MNIREAKNQIYTAVKAYRTRNEDGSLKIPAVRQRPVFLIGAPGIGKTAIVEQVARELGIG
ncbi:MAG: AAA family ATPase, partial [Clostridiales bacterium]|nr:AAA family ATPase [Clostridiales bacterium]